MNELLVGIPSVSKLLSAFHYEASASFIRSISATHGNAQQRPVL